MNFIGEYFNLLIGGRFLGLDINTVCVLFCVILISSVIIVVFFATSFVLLLSFIKHNKGRRTKISIGHRIHNNQMRLVIDLLKRNKYKLIDEKNNLWLKKYFITQYFIKIQNQQNKSEVIFWWNHPLFGKEDYPIDIPFFITVRYKMHLMRKNILKILLNNEK